MKTTGLYCSGTKSCSLKSCSSSLLSNFLYSIPFRTSRLSQCLQIVFCSDELLDSWFQVGLDFPSSFNVWNKDKYGSPVAFVLLILGPIPLKSVCPQHPIPLCLTSWTNSHNSCELIIGILSDWSTILSLSSKLSSLSRFLDSCLAHDFAWLARESIAFECLLPARWMTVKLYVPNCTCNHLAVCHVEFLKFLIHDTAALSFRSRTG